MAMNNGGGEPRLDETAGEAARVFDDEADQTAFGAREARTRAVDAASRTTRAMVDGVREMNEAATEFLATRLRKDMDAARAMATTRSFADAFAVQADFVEAAMQDYARHSARMFEIAGGCAREAAKGAMRPATPD